MLLLDIKHMLPQGLCTCCFLCPSALSPDVFLIPSLALFRPLLIALLTLPGDAPSLSHPWLYFDSQHILHSTMYVLFIVLFLAGM